MSYILYLTICLDWHNEFLLTVKQSHSENKTKTSSCCFLIELSFPHFHSLPRNAKQLLLHIYHTQREWYQTFHQTPAKKVSLCLTILLILAFATIRITRIRDNLPQYTRSIFIRHQGINNISRTCLKVIKQINRCSFETYFPN